MAFAAGKLTWAICDTCGQRYRLKQLKKQWDGFMTCPECFDIKQPQLDPRYHPTDPQALQHAKPQIANATVYVGYTNIRKANGESVASGVYDGVGDGTTVNGFQTLEESVTLYHANGVAYAGFARSMQPLSVQRPSQPTRLHSFVGNVTVTTT